LTASHHDAAQAHISVDRFTAKQDGCCLSEQWDREERAC
jgi:hypothetical protein